MRRTVSACSGMPRTRPGGHRVETPRQALQLGALPPLEEGQKSELRSLMTRHGRPAQARKTRRLSPLVGPWFGFTQHRWANCHSVRDQLTFAQYFPPTASSTANSSAPTGFGGGAVAKPG